MRNKLSNLNDHLFAQIERLSDESITDDALQQEISRAKAVTSVAREIVANGQLVLDVQVKVANITEKTEVVKFLT